MSHQKETFPAIPVFLGMHRILLFLVLIFLPIIASAQLSVGIRGGYATSTYSYQATASTRSRSVDGIGAPTFALVVEYFNSKNAGVELDIQQLTLGFRQISEEEEINQTEFTYLKLPLLASFFAGRSGRFQIKMGPHFGYLLQAEDISREYSGAIIPELPTYGQPEDHPRKLMYGITVGAGISKLFGKSTVGGDVRFSYDFTNPESRDRVYDMRSTNLEFTLVYLFRIRENK